MANVDDTTNDDTNEDDATDEDTSSGQASVTGVEGVTWGRHLMR